MLGGRLRGRCFADGGLMLGGRSVERPYNLLIICVLPLLSRSDNTVYYPRTTVRGKVAIPQSQSRTRLHFVIRHYSGLQNAKLKIVKDYGGRGLHL